MQCNSYYWPFTYQTTKMEAIVLDDSFKNLSIQLNNFLHRIDCKTTIIDISIQYSCNLKRIRRSRNWLLMGNKTQLIAVSARLRQEKIIWIAQAIEKSLPKPTVNLKLLIETNPTITVNQLMAETGCTIIEARCAIDIAEGFI